MTDNLSAAIPPPTDSEPKVVGLSLEGQCVGYVRIRTVEWFRGGGLVKWFARTRRLQFVGVDLDVRILEKDRSVSELDFAIPDKEQFVERLSSGTLSLNDVVYTVTPLGQAERERVLSEYF
ncbi:hypothetical protein [Jatrophihabitans lederbergiae]|uniref:Uncharacterized protein n=1 Tax=Jatrophihabitans lederbergiae TaxID=3075547 RepID=A0ABU2JDB7_9ACTN|nr:hypothetical protein [Jatrophihabitans sp. DSM 44399]MDT0262979.1 hypothetical protein [Jatrophihabitans sp. DSM 44399]